MAFEHDDTRTVAAPRTAEPGPASYRLTVIEGSDTGVTFTIDASRPQRVLVGTSAACDVKLADRRASRRHLSLEIAGRRLRVTDLDSTNGTFVDGVAITGAFLSGGEIVRLGATALRVDPEASEPAPAPPAASRFGRTVGQSDAMRRLYPLCERLAASNVTVIIEGETGTGKEVLAESIHEEGPRRDGPFVVFDCTAVAASLLESALFGHEKGSFTGAVATRRGVFEEANGGTLLIDEIGDLELSLQAKLLRVLQRAEVRRVGGDRAIPVDVRVLAATRRDLDREVQAGRFRDDLFFRLAVARIELPPLRERRGDIALLAEHFWKSLGGDAAGIPYEVLRRWEDSTWPGNVRELHNAVARQIALGALAAVDMSRSGPETMRPPPSTSAPAPAPAKDFMDQVVALDLPLAPARQRVLDEFERRYLERMLDNHGGSVTKAAQASGIASRYFRLLRAKQAKAE